jgi:hypothetical protein
MNSFTRVLLGIAPHWRTGVAIAGTVGIVVMCRRRLETDKARTERAHRTKEKEIRALADRIASYGRKIHHRYPTGDVVVGENDLATQLRKRPDILESERVNHLRVGLNLGHCAVGRKLFAVPILFVPFQPPVNGLTKIERNLGPSPPKRAF